MSGSGTLSEAASKELLRAHGVPVADEREVTNAADAADAADAIGYPVVVKLCGVGIAHKTERGLVRLRLADSPAVHAAAIELLGKATAADGTVSLLVAPMINGNRELIAGVVRDAQFGANVMLGVGGVLTEAIADVQFRTVPLSALDAADMIDTLATRRLLGELRGEEAVDRAQLVAVLLSLSAMAEARPEVVSVDVNPLIVTADGTVVAADALVELGDGVDSVPRRRAEPTDEQFRALFEPAGVLVAGASTHPGKFGFVGLHNLLAAGYEGAVFGTNLEGDAVLGIRTAADIAELPAGAIDLVFVCTPAAANAELLRACAAKGVKAAFMTSAGYGETGADGRRRRGRAGGAGGRVGHPARRPQRAGPGEHTCRACAPRSSLRTRLPAASRSSARAATSSAAS